MLIPENFKKIITIGQGNPYNIGVICITQRPQNTHNDIISNSSLIVCFKLNLERDAKIIYEMTGIPIESIQNLQYNHFFIYNDRDEISISKHNPI
jgi:hypothetical protein